jgi:hypothetical protein
LLSPWFRRPSPTGSGGNAVSSALFAISSVIGGVFEAESIFHYMIRFVPEDKRARVGGALWGLVGAILAIPTAAILAVVVEEFAFPGQTTEAE